LSALDSGRRRHRCFPHPALAGKKNDSQFFNPVFIIAKALMSIN
jgi:hypothetical protein